MSSVDFNSHSRSRSKRPGTALSVSHSAMPVAGDVVVCTRVAAKRSSDLNRLVNTSSALAWVVVSIASSLALGSIHTVITACRVNALGSSSRTTSSLISFACFLPGLRPVLASICPARCSTSRRTTDAGSMRVSIMNFRIHCPPTASTSAPCFSPRGSVQPNDFSCVAPHSMKRALSSPASTCAIVGDQSAPMRYNMTFLNTAALAEN